MVLSIGTLPPGERCSISKALLDVSYVAFRVPSRFPSQRSHFLGVTLQWEDFHLTKENNQNYG